MDAITMLKEDHRDVERLFTRFEKAGKKAYVEKRDIVDRVIGALSKHAAVEEQVFYPAVRTAVRNTEDTVLESLEEHHIVKWVLSELDGMDPAEERFDAKMTVLMENVRHHVQEEEKELFPRVRAEFDRATLEQIGQTMQQARDAAPEHPHPRSPDTPPGNVAAATTAAVVDRVTDTVKGAAQGSVSAVQDMVALVTGRRRPATSPTGSKTTRDTASGVRTSAAELTDEAVAVAQRAKATASTAASGAKRTVGTAVDGTKATARTAARSARRTGETARRAGSESTKKATKKATKRATTRPSTKVRKRGSGATGTSTRRSTSSSSR